MSKRKRCAAKVDRGDLLGVFGTGHVFKIRCPKLAAPGRRICRTHLAMKENGHQRYERTEDAQERTRRRRERARHEKEARAVAHVLIRRRQKAARAAQKAKEPGAKPGSQRFLPTCP